LVERGAFPRSNVNCLDDIEQKLISIIPNWWKYEPVLLWFLSTAQTSAAVCCSCTDEPSA